MPPPSTLGPYQLLNHLGRGGMGEVFLAYDPRLDRQVAIKRIRHDALDAPRQERFRREARIVAGLNHPAVVQVFDFLTTDEGEHIVMEYVPGSTLRRQLEAGRMALEDGLPVVEQIAAGLEHAHHHGVVHRDLKSENVLLTHAGNAKIADFGVARQTLFHQRQIRDPSLTPPEGAPGTFRALSPEQIREKEADARSDLFSFGVLLYETFTGQTPFAVASDLETLQRIVDHRQPSAQTLVPALPDALSTLIDDLLEKEPALRPRSAGEVIRRLRSISVDRFDDASATRLPTAAPLDATPHSTPSLPAAARPRSTRALLLVAPALALLAALAAYWFWRPQPPPLSVAVLAPEIRGAPEGDPELLAAAVRHGLLRGLVRLRGISPQNFAEIDAVAGTPLDIGRAVGAQEVVLTTLVCQPRNCDVELSRVRALAGEVAWSGRFAVPTDDLALAGRAMGEQVRLGYANRTVRSGLAANTTKAADYEELLRLRRSFDIERQTVPLAALLDRVAALRQRAEGFVDVYLLEARIALQRYYETNDADLLARAQRAVRQAVVLAPGDPAVRGQEISVLISARQYEEAEKALAALEQLVPGDAFALDLRARLLERQGDPEQALTLLGRAAAQRPSWKRLFNLASMSYRHGRLADARQQLEALLALSPENYNGLSLWAQIELVSGDPGRAAALYGKLVEKTPGPAELSNLGLAHLLLGSYAAAAAAFEQVVTTAPHNPFYLLNLADARLLQGDEETATALYRQVVARLDAETEAHDWQQLTVRAQALAHLGENGPAVAALQEALRAENSQAAFEAALVFALVGDQTAALVNAERALAQGFGPSWFAMPWFDALRTHPTFQTLLAAGAN